MRKIYIYILTLLAVLFSCQRVELPEVSEPVDNTDVLSSGRVTIAFSINEPVSVATKAYIDPTQDMETLHLLIFDEEGMLVEVAQADLYEESDHEVEGEEGEGHHDGKLYTVTLTLSDQPRRIHFIGNCPVEQIGFSQEVSLISNLYVKDGATAYWAFRRVDCIVVDPDPVTIDGKQVYNLDDSIVEQFRHIPMLRNYAEIQVVDDTPDTEFIFEGFTVYNLIDRGTVAPYNNRTGDFQSFIDNSGNAYSYTYFNTPATRYEGHYLSSSVLRTEIQIDPLTRDYKIYNPNDHIYLYEKKVSVRTDNEEDWIESPPHVIIKGRYNPNGDAKDGKSYYYKVDFIYTLKDNSDIPSSVNYYNILRNFKYQFNIAGVHAVGYEKLADAIKGAAGNNMSGSASATKLTNISYDNGRLWVSYTDTTLVTGDAIALKYKYIPNAFQEDDDDSQYKYNDIHNELVKFEVDTDNDQDDATDDVINDYNKRYVIDPVTNQNTKLFVYPEGHAWEGYSELILSINEPSYETKLQTVTVKTNNINLYREVRYYLDKKYTMVVDCTPKVLPSMKEKVQVDIKLPTGLQSHMFPLELQIETWDRTLYPDVSSDVTSRDDYYALPVVAGTSAISRRLGEKTFYYVATIPTLEEYNALDDSGNYKVLHTHWLTNYADNASTVYVNNKYFQEAYDNWENYKYEFSDAKLSLTDIPYGVGMGVDVSFTLDNDDSDRLSRDIKLLLTGLTHPDAVTQNGTTVLTVQANSGKDYIAVNNNTVKVTGFTTTTEYDATSVRIDASEYLDAPLTSTRSGNTFENPHFSKSSIALGKGNTVDYIFTIPEGRYYDDMTINVTLDGLEPVNKEQLVVIPSAQEIKMYIFTPNNGAGEYTLNLKTTKDQATCSVELESSRYYYAEVRSEIQQLTAQYYFINVNVPETVAEVKDKEVKISFDLDSDDENKSREIDLTLDGLRLNDVNDVVKANNGHVEFTAVTTKDKGPVTISFGAAEYYPSDTYIIERTQTVTYSGEVEFDQEVQGINFDVANQNITITSITINSSGDGITYTKGDKTKYTRRNPTRTLHLHLSSIEIERENISKETILTFVVMINRTSVTFTRTIGELSLE